MWWYIFATLLDGFPHFVSNNSKSLYQFTNNVLKFPQLRYRTIKKKKKYLLNLTKICVLLYSHRNVLKIGKKRGPLYIFSGTPISKLILNTEVQKNACLHMAINFGKTSSIPSFKTYSKESNSWCLKLFMLTNFLSFNMRKDGGLSDRFLSKKVGAFKIIIHERNIFPSL